MLQIVRGSSRARAPDGEVEQDLARLVEGGDHAALGHARLIRDDHVRDRLRSMPEMLQQVLRLLKPSIQWHCHLFPTSAFALSLPHTQNTFKRIHRHDSAVSMHCLA